MSVSFFKYVLHHDIPAYEALGWKDLKMLVDTHHGFYAELMQWMGGGEPVMPTSVMAQAMVLAKAEGLSWAGAGNKRRAAWIRQVKSSALPRNHDRGRE